MIQFHNGWEYDLKVGNDGENYFSKLLRDGREFYTVEVKTDQRMHERDRWNVFIETESRGKPGGIKHTEADYWAIQSRNKKLSIVIETDLLRKVCEVHESDLTTGGDNGTSRGHLIHLPQFIRTILQYLEA